MAFAGESPFQPNIYNSYSLQAESWLQGRLDLGQNYEHLEIATFQNQYFVSFPPFPSIVMLPFVAIFGSQTPDHLIVLAAAVIACIFAYKLAIALGQKKNKALFYSLFLCVGSNFLFVSMRGGVWFMAQVFAFALTLAAFYYAAKKDSKPALSLFLFCCALGCRPLSVIYLPLLLYLLYDKRHTILVNLKKLAIAAAPAVLLGAFYMLLNFLRFRSIFEFGHNYLPEFVDAEHGQFSPVYLADNLANLWRLPQIVDGQLRFYQFDGTAFWLVSPIVITYLFTLIRRLVQWKKIKRRQLIIFAAIFASLAAHLVLLCLHKTMGGWHFGHRYTVDILPVLFLGLLLQDQKDDNHAALLSVPLFAIGMITNAVGTIFLYLNLDYFV